MSYGNVWAKVFLRGFPKHMMFMKIFISLFPAHQQILSQFHVLVYFLVSKICLQPEEDDDEDSFIFDTFSIVKMFNQT